MPLPVILENELLRFPPVGVVREDDNSTVRKAIIPYVAYDNPTDVAMIYRGYAFVDTDGRISRFLPWKDPTDPLQYCMATTYQGLAFGDGRVDATVPDVPMQTGLSVENWVFTLTFSTVPFDVGTVDSILGDGRIAGFTPTLETSRFCTKVVREGREYISPPQGSLYLGTATTLPDKRTSIPYSTPFLIPYAEIDVVWYHVPAAAYPKKAIDRCQGRVNSAVMTLPSRPDGITTYAADTILFLGARQQEMRFPDSSFGYNIHYFFKRRGDDNAGAADGPIKGVRNLSWNTLPNSQNEWLTAYRGKDASSPKFYEAADLNDLFKSQLAS